MATTVTRKRTGRPAFGNPKTRSAATLWKMGAWKRNARSNRWTGHLLRYQTAMAARTL